MPDALLSCTGMLSQRKGLRMEPSEVRTQIEGYLRERQEQAQKSEKVEIARAITDLSYSVSSALQILEQDAQSPLRRAYAGPKLDGWIATLRVEWQFEQNARRKTRR